MRCACRRRRSSGRPNCRRPRARSRAARASPAERHRRRARTRRPRAAGAGVVVRHRIGGAAQGDGRRRSRDPRDLSRYRLAVRGDAGLSRHPDRDARACATSARSSRSRRTLAREDPDRELWFSDPDACCRIRKVEPLARALKPFGGWINGRKRFQGGLRAAIAVVEADGARLKFNPFANVSREEIEAIFTRANLPPHPLAAIGLPVGRLHALHHAGPRPDEDARAGRWRGRAKTECGIHTSRSEDPAPFEAHRNPDTSSPFVSVRAQLARNRRLGTWSSFTIQPRLVCNNPSGSGETESCGRRSAIVGLLVLGGCAGSPDVPSSPACISAWPMAGPGSMPRSRPR